MRVRTALLVVAVTVAAGCSSGASPPTGKTWTGAFTPLGRTLHLDGRTRSYSVLLPRHRRPHPPLVIVLHLLGGTATTITPTTPVARAAYRSGAVVVAPDGIGFSWNAGTCCGDARRDAVDDVGFLRAVISDAARRDDIDRSRVYAIGFSNGGLMAYRAACDGVPFAGVAVVEATMTVSRCAPARPMDLLAIHQTGDAIVPYTGAATPNVVGATAPFPPVRDAFARWLAAQECARVRRTTSGPVTTLTAACPSRTRARLVVMIGGRHVWPAAPEAPVDATTTVLQFLGITPAS